MIIICWKSRKFRGEWPSGLKYYIQNEKVPGSNPTGYAAKLWDPTLLQGSCWPAYQNQKFSDWHWVSEAASLAGTQSWPWGRQIADKKMSVIFKQNFLKNSSNILNCLRSFCWKWQILHKRATKFFLILFNILNLLSNSCVASLSINIVLNMTMHTFPWDMCDLAHTCTGTHTSKFTCAIYCICQIIALSLFVLLLLYISCKENFSLKIHRKFKL